MKQVICDKCKEGYSASFHRALEIRYGGNIKCSLDLCDKCCTEYGITPSTFNVLEMDTGLRLLEELKELIRETE